MKEKEIGKEEEILGNGKGKSLDILEKEKRKKNK